MTKIRCCALAIILTAPLAAPRAEACEYLPRTIEEIRFSARHGDTVPTNLVLTGNGIDEDDGSSWWLVDDDVSIRLTMTETSLLSTRFVPASPLSASTAYALRWSPTDDPTAAADPALGAVLLTTSTGDDDEAPAVPPFSSVATFQDKDVPGFCEQPVDLIAARFDVAPATIGDVAAIAVLDEDGETLAAATVAHGIYLVFYEPLESGVRSYRLIFTDHAGNTSEATATIDLDEPLEPTEPTEPDDTDAPETPSSASSCASMGFAGVSPLAALLLARRRRARR